MSTFRASSCSVVEEGGTTRTIVLSANSDWNIVNFRSGLIRSLRSAGYSPVVIAPEDPASAERMRQFNVERIPIPMDRSSLNPATDLRLLANYWAVLKRLQPAAYLGYTIKPNIYGSLAADSLGIPAVPNVSGLGTAFMRQGPLQQVVSRMYRAGFKRSPVVFFQNDEDKRLFVDRQIVRGDQARVLPGSGVDLARFSPVRLPDGPAVFLLVARLLKDKGVVEFVEAARSLRNSFPDARFQMLGPIDAANRSSISRPQLDRWIEEGVIEYLGTADDVRPHIAAATAVVLPSYREGVPRSLLEAAAMCRPLIATDVPGCRDVVDDGVNGYLCAARDPSSLAAVIRRMADVPVPQRAAMGQAARGTVEKRFGEERVISAYLEVLASLQSAGRGCHV